MYHTLYSGHTLLNWDIERLLCDSGDDEALQYEITLLLKNICKHIHYPALYITRIASLKNVKTRLITLKWI